MEIVKGGAVHDEPLLENGKVPNEFGEKVPLGQRFKISLADVCTLTVPCAHAIGYLLLALLGSLVLVLTVVAPIVAELSSHALAQLASPGYNCTLDWIAQKLAPRITGIWVYVVMSLFACACAGHAFIVLRAAWVLLCCCRLKVTCRPQSPPAFRARLIMWTLLTHFRRIGVVFLVLMISVLVVYPLILLGVPCLSGVMIAQLIAAAPIGSWNIFLYSQFRVIMRLPDKDVSAPTMDKKMLTRRFNRAGYPGI